MGRQRRRPPRNVRHGNKPNERPQEVNGTGSRPMHDDGRVVLRENALFEQFYKAQKIVPDDEWAVFMESLRTDLPSSFRLVGYRKETEVLLRLLKDRYLTKMSDVMIDGVPVQPPKEISWYPGGLGFQMTLSRKVVRRQPLLSAFHNFLVTETEMGNISRQETVSMIPPLLLDVQPHHKVFDMCAAPGSKTAQLIEMLHNNEDGNGTIPSGFVLANDSDNKRCYLLVHQSLKRLNSPCCLISNADATFIPTIQLSETDGKSNAVKFDRILCDVPCSGDGTMRKNLGVWKDWSLYHAYNLHKIQFRIAKRGLELLAVGGIMVYSTCSLNPAEDEATVYRLLEYAKGAVELVDVSDKLMSLIRSPGLYNWTIMDKKGTTLSSYDDVPTNQQKQIPAGVFPPPESDAKEAHLERCFRILPHQQDTGGFFVAVLRKVRDIHPAKVAAELDQQAVDGASSGLNETEVKKDVEVASNSGQRSSLLPPPQKKPKYSGFKEDPFMFLDSTDTWWNDFRNFFDVKNEFPYNQLLYRCNDRARKRNIYFVNAAVKSILENNASKIKFINAGLRVCTRTDEREDQFCYRLAQEGLKVILPFLAKRLIRLGSQEDFVKLIRSANVLITDLSSDIRSQFDELSEGSLAIIYQRPLDDYMFMLSAWRGKVSIAAYAAQEYRVHTLRMLDQDTASMEEEMVQQRKTGKSKDKSEKEVSNEGDSIITKDDESMCD